jgi:hypothetical protein
MARADGQQVLHRVERDAPRVVREAVPNHLKILVTNRRQTSTNLGQTEVARTQHLFHVQFRLRRRALQIPQPVQRRNDLLLRLIHVRAAGRYLSRQVEASHD